jgi:hypothetical protein
VRLESLLQRLETEQARLAAEALKQPAARDAFEYGRVIGMYAGLELAKASLLAAVADEEDRGRHL